MLGIRKKTSPSPQSPVSSYQFPVPNPQFPQKTIQMKTHKDLEVWKKAVNFVTDLYKLTQDFPKEELYGLTSQMRRAAISIPSNIAEGSARQGNKELVQFLYIALGSVVELDTQLIIARNLSYINEEKFIQLIVKLEEIAKMLNGLINYRKTKL